MLTKSNEENFLLKLLIQNFAITVATVVSLSMIFSSTNSMAENLGNFEQTGIAIKWNNWSEDAFKKSHEENKFVMLVLGADWSEDTQRMRENTFSDPLVAKIANESYIPIWVDVDNHLMVKHLFAGDIYPKLVVLTPQKRIVASLEGLTSATKTHLFLYNLLKKNSFDLIDSIVDLSSIENTTLTPHQRLRLLEYFSSQVDWYGGGYQGLTKKLPESMLLFLLSQDGNRQYDDLIKRTLSANYQLFDPIWGGVYRNSRYGTWQKPNFEKLTIDQGRNISIYSLAYMRDKDPKYRNAALSIASYLEKWVQTSNGAFYSSQSGYVQNESVNSKDYFSYDDTQRRAFGVPIVSNSILTDANASVAESLLLLARASGKTVFAEKAKALIEWILANLRLPNQTGFRHNLEVDTPPYLEDNLSVAQATLTLFETEQDAKWLKITTEILDYIELTFFETKNSKPLSGAVVGIGDLDIDGGTRRNVEQNCNLVRIAIRAYHYTMNPKYRHLASRALAFLVAVNPDMQVKYADSILLAYQDYNQSPFQFAIVGKKEDLRSKELLMSALRYPYLLKRVNIFDNDSPDTLQTLNIAFPPVTNAAIFACVDKRCTAAIYQAENLNQALINAGLKQ